MACFKFLFGLYHTFDFERLLITSYIFSLLNAALSPVWIFKVIHNSNYDFNIC